MSEEDVLIVRRIINDMPTYEAFEVVRCGECKHWNKTTKGCARNALFEAWQENDFCCYGERRSE